MAPAPRQRLVLDTNVWLDWLVFGDRAVAPIGDALARGLIEIARDDACEGELRRVLAYPRLALDAARQAACLLRLRDCSVPFPAPAPARVAALPRCRDGDDQKFLELACSAGAHWLLTRDKALLSISRGRLAQTGFGVATPAAWAQRCRPGQPA